MTEREKERRVKKGRGEEEERRDNRYSRAIVKIFIMLLRYNLGKKHKGKKIITFREEKLSHEYISENYSQLFF